MKFLLSTFTVLSLGLLSSFTVHMAQALVDPSTPELIEPTVVQIKSYNVLEDNDELEAVGIGSGSVITESGVIMTSSSILKDPQNQEADIIEICYIDDEFTDPDCDEIAQIIDYDNDSDLVFLSPIARYNSLSEVYEDLPSAIEQETISAETLVANQSNILIFSDVNNTTRFASAIQFLKENNIVGGYPDGSFKPNNTINRAEFVKILIEAVFPSTSISECLNQINSLFTDVPNDQWYSSYVCMAKRFGIVGGYPDGSFQAGNTINFAEAAKILVNTLKIPVQPATAGEPWYAPFINALLDVNAVPNTLLDPGQSITRGEMAEMIFRLQSYLSTATEAQTEISNENTLETNSSDQSSSPDAGIASMQLEVIALVNEERAKEGLTPMVYNPILELAAQAHSDDMRAQNYFQHDSLDGTTPDQRIQQAGYLKSYDECNCSKRSATGENIAKGQTTAQEVVQTWMESPEHRANIMDPDFNEIGIGITPVDPTEENFIGYFWVQNFGFIELNL